MNGIDWVFRDFTELTALQVFDMLELRCEVFIVEQNCPYQDPDRKDKESFHLLGYSGDTLAGCLRIVRPGISYQEASIGRVCTKLAFRRTGLGKVLMERALLKTLELGWTDVRISAQLYLEKFYTDLGFRTVSKAYMEDDIPHIQMLLER